VHFSTKVPPAPSFLILILAEPYVHPLQPIKAKLYLPYNEPLTNVDGAPKALKAAKCSSVI